MGRKQENLDNCLYFDISKQERDSAIRYLLGAILKSRGESDFPSNYYTYDEDVNVYLAHLLFAVSLPEYHEMAEPYLSADTSDILQWVRATEDRTIRYFIFKVNADHILMHTAVFEDLNKKSRGLFRKSAKHYQEVGKLYYEQAAAYHKKIYRKKTGVGEVLVKLANYFDCYQEVLLRVRREYFHFVNNFKDQAFNHFVREVKQYERNFLHKDKIDRFLDLYGQWLDTKNPQLVESIREVVCELRALDPQFRFDVDQEILNRRCQDEKKCA